MLEGIAKLLIKKSSIFEISILVLISTYILLFNPSNIVQTLKMEEFIEKFQLFFGILFILSLSFFLLQLLKKILSIVKKIYININLNKNLKELTKEEINFLKNYFYDSKTKNYNISAYAPWSNGYTNLLVSKGIIYWSGGNSALVEMIDFEQCVPFNLAKRSYNYLNKKK